MKDCSRTRGAGELPTPPSAAVFALARTTRCDTAFILAALSSSRNNRRTSSGDGSDPRISRQAAVTCTSVLARCLSARTALPRTTDWSLVMERSYAESELSASGERVGSSAVRAMRLSSKS
eukprot:4675636-Prymnesium_polylepis.1